MTAPFFHVTLFLPALKDLWIIRPTTTVHQWMQLFRKYSENTDSDEVHQYCEKVNSILMTAWEMGCFNPVSMKKIEKKERDYLVIRFHFLTEELKNSFENEIASCNLVVHSFSGKKD